MKKSHAQVMVLVGIGMIALGFYTIYVMYKITYEVNSQPNPPATIIFWVVPYLLWPVDTGLGWNLVFFFMITGAFLTGWGIPKYNLVTHRYN